MGYLLTGIYLSSPLWGSVGLALDGIVNHDAAGVLPLRGRGDYLVPWITIARTATKTVGITISTVMYDNLRLFSKLNS